MILLLFLLVLFLVGCAQLQEDKSPADKVVSKQTTPASEVLTKTTIGPSGCSSGAECGAACSQNPLDCRAWCKLNQESCLQLGLNSVLEMPEGTPNSPCTADNNCIGGLICLNFKCTIPSPDNLAKQSGFRLPGNCKSMKECAAFCGDENNNLECSSFCGNFPSFCTQGRTATATPECKSCLSCNSKSCILDCTYDCYQYTSVEEPDLNALKAGSVFERNYQQPIKAVWEPGPAYNHIGITYFVDDYKELGVNTYSITPKYSRQSGKLIHTIDRATGEKADTEKIASIIKAKKAGLQVVLVAHDLYDMFPDANRNEQFNPQEYIEEIKATSLKWARIAEEYKVEYFVPINEFEYILYENGYPAEQACEITGQMYKEVIPKVREFFNGKIYCRVGGMDAKFGCMDFSLCDVFGFTYGFSGGKEYQSNFEALFRVGEELYEKYQKPYLMAEAFALLFRDTTLTDCANLHKAGMTVYKEKAIHGIGYTFMGLVQRDPINKNDCTIKMAGVADDYKKFFTEMR